uniref:Uncharacterized protein n=1 Tax=Oryza sativa subsp. japonica TaxID=39947 RepID=Q8H411_ORYSJ|nr:hypothetical protein [Oryza sativa Japonica Group]
MHQHKSTGAGAIRPHLSSRLSGSEGVGAASGGVEQGRLRRGVGQHRPAWGGRWGDGRRAAWGGVGWRGGGRRGDGRRSRAAPGDAARDGGSTGGGANPSAASNREWPGARSREKGNGKERKKERIVFFS